MQLENGQMRFTAIRADGVEIVESPSVGFADVPIEEIIGFKIDVEGQTFGVDLVSGLIFANDQAYNPAGLPNVPLRLVYYKTMRANMNQAHGAFESYVYSFVVGWQATLTDETPYRNIRFGLKVFPTERRWEVTEDI